LHLAQWRSVAAERKPPAAEAEAKSFVGTPPNWFVIKHLAGELLKRRTMTGPEVEAAIWEGRARALKGAAQRSDRRGPPIIQKDPARS